MRALKYHGGVDVKELNKENLAALEKGLANLERHVNNVRNHYGLPVRRLDQPLHRTTPTAEIDAAAGEDGAARRAGGARHALGRRRQGRGRAGAGRGRPDRASRANFQLRLRGRRYRCGTRSTTIATKIYGASDVTADSKVRGADQEAAGGRLRPLPGVRGEDPVLVLDRPDAARRAVRPRASTSAKCALPPARSSSSWSAATS